MKVKSAKLRIKGQTKKIRKAAAVAPTTVPEEESELIEGIGRIVSSGCDVHGRDTKFMEELSPGDIIFVHHPTSMLVEGKAVEKILSERGLVLTEEFSTDLVSTCAYHFRKDGRMTENQTESAIVPLKYTSKLESKYRVKSGMWSYKNLVENTKRELSAEERLNLRVKHSGRDKFC